MHLAKIRPVGPVGIGHRSIGKPVHLIRTGYEDWRWGKGETTPGYPTMRIYCGNVGRSVKRIGERLRNRTGDALMATDVPSGLTVHRIAQRPFYAVALHGVHQARG